LDEPRLSEKIALKHVKALKRVRVSSVGLTGADMQVALQGRLAALPIGEFTVNDVISEAIDTIDSQRWRIERTARTETSRAYNQVYSEGIDKLAEEIEGVRKRWTEYVSDITGDALDDKVGDDSLVLHGQLAGEGGLFYMPDDDLAPDSMIGQSWLHPPNRPNDRATVLPWMKEWGVPAWYYLDGDKVQVIK